MKCFECGKSEASCCYFVLNNIRDSIFAEQAVFLCRRCYEMQKKKGEL